jgi:hypothetical protein
MSELSHIAKDLVSTVLRYPNDMELGNYIRQQTLLIERQHKRNKDIHIKKDIE